MTLPRATRAALARLYLLEADRGVWNGIEQRYEPPEEDLDPQELERGAPDRVEHLRALANEADRETYLYHRASKPAEIRELLKARGRPGLADLVWSLATSPDPPGLCEMYARNLERGTTGNGFFERGEAMTQERRRKLVAALRWCAEAYRRAPKRHADLPASKPR